MLHGNYNTLPYPARAVAVLSLRLVAQIMKLGTQRLDADSFAKFVPMIVDTKYHERPGAVERINAVYRRKLKNIRFSNPVLCHQQFFIRPYTAAFTHTLLPLVEHQIQGA